MSVTIVVEYSPVMYALSFDKQCKDKCIYGADGDDHKYLRIMVLYSD